MKRLCVIILVLAVLISSCGIKMNLDIQEAVFPPDHSIIVYQDATSKGFKDGSTLSLMGIGDAGYSSWEELHIENLTEHEINFDGLPKISNTDIFEIRDSLFKYKIGPYERSAFEVRYKLADIGSVETDVTIDYRVNERKRRFAIRLNGNFIGLQIVEVVEANPPTIPTEIERNLPNGGAGVDFGYKSADQAKRKFRVKNNSNERITVHSISLDPAALIAGFNFDGQTELSLGTISANSSKDFELIFPESSMPTYKEGNIVIRHDRSPLPYKIAVCGGGHVMPIEIVHRKNGQDVSCVVPYKLDKNCYDFGYKPAVSEPQTISIKNMSKAILRFENIDVDLDSGPFTLEKNYGDTELVYPGEKAGLEIKFTPQADVWSEKDITINDKNTGRKYIISLTGSGFKQPKDTGLTSDGLQSLALWLRADRIGREHIKNINSTNKVAILPDVSGRFLDAYAYKGDGPSYIKSGINGLPVVSFTAPEGLAVTTKDSDWITYNAEGTTGFVVFKTGGGADKRLAHQVILLAASGDSRVLPSFGTNSIYFDPKDGLYGNGPATGQPSLFRRFFVDSSYFQGHSHRHPAFTKQYDIPDGNVFSVGIRFDSKITSAANPNVHLFINGNESNSGYPTGAAPLGYLQTYSQGALSEPVRAYGYPIGDGHGNRRTTHIGSSKDESPCKWDFAWNYGKTHSIFGNRVSNGAQYNGTIRSLYIGKNAAGENNFYGEIAEIIIFNRALSDDEIKEVNKYINIRYGVQPIEKFYREYPEFNIETE